jgi:hypothetical protein
LFFGFLEGFATLAQEYPEKKHQQVSTHVTCSLVNLHIVGVQSCLKGSGFGVCFQKV